MAEDETAVAERPEGTEGGIVSIVAFTVSETLALALPPAPVQVME
jgi:hypothetical protein